MFWPRKRAGRPICEGVLEYKSTTFFKVLVLVARTLIVRNKSIMFEVKANF